jgi:hypothetical protein
MTAEEIENKITDLYFFMLERNIGTIVVPLKGSRKIICSMENELIVIKPEIQENRNGNN